MTDAPPVIPPDARLSVTILADGKIMVWQPDGRTAREIADILRTVADGFDDGPTRIG